jgi:hypothetical protein
VGIFSGNLVDEVVGVAGNLLIEIVVVLMPVPTFRIGLFVLLVVDRLSVESNVEFVENEPI